VKQQSEHLSNAQIEQYGKRASGAGPETEAWVEQHLDDCPSCRNRVLDFQRTRFALFPDPKVNKVSSSDCSSEDDLRNLAAGLYPDPKAAQLKAHAATCGRCGPLLQEYIEDFSDDSSPEEQLFLDQLRTASPEFRQQKARKMFEQEILKKNPVIPEPVPSTDWRSFFSWKWILIPATAVIALAAIIFPVYLAQHDSPEKVEGLLAQAYTEQRPMEMRWPGAEWGPVHVTRGASESNLSRPLTLLKAEKVIAGRRIDSSSRADWLVVKGEAELLDHEPQAAINDLTQALNPGHASTRIELLLAIAYAYQGDLTDDRGSRGKALKILTKVLQENPDNPIALFNRALLYERLNLPDRARTDYNTLIKNEKDSGWASEVRGKLTELGKTN
jgi:tetratricopeptide (TPR) repeat protein